MNETSRAQGWAITVGAGVAALFFVLGILNGSYWAIAIPVAIVTLFALGLVAWVGYTIATIQVEADITGARKNSTTRTIAGPRKIVPRTPLLFIVTSPSPRSSQCRRRAASARRRPIPSH